MEIKWVPFVGNTGYIIAAGALIPTHILNEKEVVFIDSGVHYDPGLISFIRAVGVSVYAVLQTHLHEDHCANNRIMISRFGTRIFAHPAEIEVVRSVENMHESWFVSQPETADKYLRSYRYPIEPVDLNSKEIVLRGTTFRVEPLYGHSQGHLGFVTPDNVLCTGDALLSPTMVKSSKMPFFDNIAQTMESMRKIAELDYPYYALAHMEILEKKDIPGLVQKNLELLESIHERILSVVDGPVALDDLMDKVMSSLGIRLHNPVKRAYLRHTLKRRITYLTETGRLTEVVVGGETKYKLP